MDFIARAGSMIERAHRISGLLLLLIFFETIFLMYYAGVNSDLNRSFQKLRDELPVYVIPGSTADMYTPSKSEMLLRNFVDHMTQSLNSYTHASLEAQYNEARKFFTPDTLMLADGEYRGIISKAQSLSQSALFVPNRVSYTMEEIPSPKDAGEKWYQVSLEGTTQYILGDNVVQAVPVRMILQMKRVPISNTNPFGFLLASYRKEEMALPGTGGNGSTPTPAGAPSAAPQQPQQ